MFYRLATVTLLATLFASAIAQQLCNGHQEFCNKTFDELTYIITHNSYGFMPNPAANQLCPVTTQLDDGVRGLKLSAVKPSNQTSNAPENAIHLCHTSCSILDAGPAVDTLKNITQWVKDNPNEVITIMWNNIGDYKVQDFEAAYKASGILDYVHVQAWENLTWPKLQDMIQSGKRVVNFLDNNSDQTKVPWLMSQFPYVFETPYDNKNESSFSCVIDRPQDPPDPDNMMYVMNHFLYGTLNFGNTQIEIPQKGSADTTNSDSLKKQAQTCTQTFGRQPNYLEVDFYNYGDTLSIAAQLNNVTYDNKPLQCDAYVAQSAQKGNGKKSDASHFNVGVLAPFMISLFPLLFLL
ncbi:PLC-like phosphodiesterase [Radiomyces spectabilis]|uniref:PLC-like phosphodiesterase n=1 Tax=Radiomyces spectabilis TaxID=64574 RepID=UPI00221F04B7|nr:PLC-like phosphodiesterase [Radiomyces spectabilis]KAI8365909.1 PLC-like phosphodiesterase [Radiomyces spectabilis]